jgi:hypothetical protein
MSKGLDLPPVRVATGAASEDPDPTTAPSGISLLERHRKLRSTSLNKGTSQTGP